MHNVVEQNLQSQNNHQNPAHVSTVFVKERSTRTDSGVFLTLAKESPIGTLPKRVPMTRSTFSFCRMPSKMHGICRENTSMTSLSFCTQHMSKSLPLGYKQLCTVAGTSRGMEYNVADSYACKPEYSPPGL